MTPRNAVEFFEPLSAIAGIRHGFTQRVPGIDVQVDRELALERLDAVHAAARSELGLGAKVFATAQQVHGNAVVRVDASNTRCIGDADGLITDDPSVCLGIYVADCCAVYLVDPVRRAIGLLHSGRKGTELGITAAAIAKMAEEFGSDPRDLVVQLSPCIRPPHYEVDFAVQIADQARGAKVRQVYDSGACTACNLERYYSYRLEKGKTGRMLALLALD